MLHLIIMVSIISDNLAHVSLTMVFLRSSRLSPANTVDFHPQRWLSSYFVPVLIGLADQRA
jgi:hypothetical protein